MKNITGDIINVGVDDPKAVLFENQYRIARGMAYNSYLICDEKIALMDTVDASVTAEWLANLETSLSGRGIDFLVVQHMEPDHSGSIAVLYERFPEMKIVASAQAFGMMKQFCGIDMSARGIVVKEGDVLALGKHKLRFLVAPLVHWPEVMVSYESSEKILFSADAFGKFGTKDALEEWTCEARRYYFNICGKYGVQVQNLMKKVENLDVKIIASLHGPVLMENIKLYIEKYKIWSSYEPEESGVFIAYASIYGNTAAAAWKMKELLLSAGEKKVIVTDLSREDIHEAVAEAFRYDRLILASASYDGGVFPPMESFLHHLKNKNFQKRQVALVENGSWGPCAGRAMGNILETMKDITLVKPIITIKSVMTAENIQQMEALAKTLTEPLC